MSEDPSDDDAPDKGYPPDANGHCYRAAWHFDERMRTAAKHLLYRQGSFIERWGLALVMLISAGATVAGFAWLRYFPINVFCFALMAIGIWIGTRAKRMVRRIVAERLCLRCGYPLLHAPVDESGFGRCPECGRRFHGGEYRRPPRGYDRTLANLQAALDSAIDAAQRKADRSSSSP